MILWFIIGGALQAFLIFEQYDQWWKNALQSFSVFLFWPVIIVGLILYALLRGLKAVVLGTHLWYIDPEIRSKYKFREFVKFGWKKNRGFKRNHLMVYKRKMIQAQDAWAEAAYPEEGKQPDREKVAVLLLLKRSAESAHKHYRNENNL